MTRAIAARRVNAPGSSFPVARLASAVAATAALAFTLLAASARAQEGPPPDDDLPPVTEVPLDDNAQPDTEPPGPAEVAERLGRLESRLERLEGKLDRLEALLRKVHGERLRRAEMLAADPALADAVRRLEERHGIAHADEYLIADETERVMALAKRLARTSVERGSLTFCSDPDVARVVGAIAGRSDYMAEGGHRLVVSVAGGEPEAVGALVEALLDLGSTHAREAALWAAPFAKIKIKETVGGEGLSGRLSRLAADRDADDARLALLAYAAAASHGDRAAEDALAEIVRSRAVDGAFALRVATNLRAARSAVAFRVYLELVRDEKYAYAAAQAFSAVGGFGRTIGWREVREGRDGLYDELADWLRRNRARLRSDRGRFSLEPEEKDGP